MKLMLTILVVISLPAEILSQACCSAGTPILSSLETSTAAKNSIQISLAYDYNNLQTVLSGSEQLVMTQDKGLHKALFSKRHTALSIIYPLQDLLHM